MRLINDEEFQDGNLDIGVDQEASEDDDDLGLGEEDSRHPEATELENSE